MNASTDTTIEATYRIVTPMFCGGASPAVPELRLPSFKGALRFWWRTLQPGRGTDVAALRDCEANLFGSADRRFGRSKVRMRLIRNGCESAVEKDAILADGRLPGAHYLGYGLVEAFNSPKKGTRAGQLIRGMIRGGEFTLECRIARSVARGDVDDVRRALLMLGTLGGLGSRTRNGFGSLSLSRLVINGEQPPLPNSIEDRLKLSIATLAPGLPDWTAWSTHSRVVVTTHPSSSDPWTVLDELGQEQISFRSWRHKGQVLSQEAERNFRHDHDLMKDGGRDCDFPHRVAFGLPHNYGSGRDRSVTPAGQSLERRASPLFLHVHQPDPEEDPIGVATFLPARFLPDDAKLNAFGRSARVPNNDESFWFPIQGWLDRLCANGNRPPDRPGYDRFSNPHWWRRKSALTGQEVPLA